MLYTTQAYIAQTLYYLSAVSILTRGRNLNKLTAIGVSPLVVEGFSFISKSQIKRPL